MRCSRPHIRGVFPMGFSEVTVGAAKTKDSTDPVIRFPTEYFSTQKTSSQYPFGKYEVTVHLKSIRLYFRAASDKRTFKN